MPKSSQINDYVENNQHSVFQRRCKLRTSNVIVTDWKVKLNKHPNNISDLHLLLTCQAFCWLCVRTSVNSSYLGGASVHWFAAGSVSVYCTGCGFNDTWYTPCGETRSVVVILLRSGGPEKSTYPVPGTKNKKYEYQSYYVLAVCPTCILLKGLKIMI